MKRKDSEAPKNVNKPLLLVYLNSLTIVVDDFLRFFQISIKKFLFLMEFFIFLALPLCIFHNKKNLSSTFTLPGPIPHKTVGSMNKI